MKILNNVWESWKQSKEPYCSLLAVAFTSPLFQLRPVFSSVFLLDEWSCTLRTFGWFLLSYSPSFPFVANVSQCGSVDSRSLRKSFIILHTLIQTSPLSSPLEYLLNVLPHTTSEPTLCLCKCSISWAFARTRLAVIRPRCVLPSCNRFSVQFGSLFRFTLFTQAQVVLDTLSFFNT